MTGLPLQTLHWCDDDDLWGGGGGGGESLISFNNLEDQISQIAAFNTDLNISELETVCHHCKTYQLSEIQIVFSPKYNLYFITLDMSETVFRAFCVAIKIEQC